MPDRNQGRCWRHCTPDGAPHGVGISGCGEIPITRKSLRATSGLRESAARQSGLTGRQKSDCPNRSTPLFDAFRSGATGPFHSAGSEILGNDEVPGSIPGAGSRIRSEGAGRRCSGRRSAVAARRSRVVAVRPRSGCLDQPCRRTLQHPGLADTVLPAASATLQTRHPTRTPAHRHGPVGPQTTRPNSGGSVRFVN